MFYFLFFFH